MSYLIAGLGNPEEAYSHTRHNIGFRVLDQLADRLSTSFSIARYGQVAKGRHKGRSLLLLKPNTYMNLSGKAIRYYLTQHIGLSRLLVVVDDISLPLGKLRLRGKGSDGGHNGLSHINQTLNTTSYARLRLGIGNEFPKGSQANYVLSPFTSIEEHTLLDPIQKAIDMLLSFCTQGLSRTMNQYH